MDAYRNLTMVSIAKPNHGKHVETKLWQAFPNQTMASIAKPNHGCLSKPNHDKHSQTKSELVPAMHIPRTANIDRSSRFEGEIYIYL